MVALLVACGGGGGAAATTAGGGDAAAGMLKLTAGARQEDLTVDTAN